MLTMADIEEMETTLDKREGRFPASEVLVDGAIYRELLARAKAWERVRIHDKRYGFKDQALCRIADDFSDAAAKGFRP